MSALEGCALWPARRMRMMAWSIVAYCIQKLGLGMRLLKLRTCEPWGERVEERMHVPGDFRRQGWGEKKNRNKGIFDLAPPPVGLLRLPVAEADQALWCRDGCWQWAKRMPFHWRPRKVQSLKRKSHAPSTDAETCVLQAEEHPECAEESRELEIHIERTVPGEMKTEADFDNPACGVWPSLEEERRASALVVRAGVSHWWSLRDDIGETGPRL